MMLEAAGFLIVVRYTVVHWRRRVRTLAWLAVAFVAIACDRRDDHDMTPLMHAAWRGDTSAIRALRPDRDDLNARVEPHSNLRSFMAFIMWMQALPDRNPGWTALFFAVDSSRHDAARMLLDAGADPSVRADVLTPLDIAVFRGDMKMVRLLLERGAPVASATGNLQHPLMFAAQRNDTSLLRLMLVRGAPVDHADRVGMTALMLAAEAGAGDAVRLLLRAGADPNRVDRKGWRAARYALASGHDATIQLLAASGESQDDVATQQLFDAIAAGDARALTQALEAGADPNAVQEQGRSALMEASGNLPEASLFELIDAGARIRTDEAGPLLYVSVVRGHHLLFERLIELGEKPRDSYIADAVRARQIEMVKRLLSMGLDPNARDVTQRSAIELARLRDDVEMIKLFEKYEVK